MSMLRFIALLWDTSDMRAANSATRITGALRTRPDAWQQILDASGMKIFLTPASDRNALTYRLANSRGVVIGTLFKPGPENNWRRCDALIDDRESCEIVSTGGRQLVERYWGGYVAFLRCPQGAHYRIIRDCSGRFACYWGENEGVCVVFSDVRDFVSTSVRPLTIDTGYLAAFIYNPHLQVRQCGLRGINEILAGECVEVHRAQRHQFPLWSPSRICRSGWLDDYRSAIDGLKSTTQQCIDAWASQYKTVLHSLSGGFDSAAVLGCLARSAVSPKITCINRFSLSAADDERCYARRAAGLAGVSLLEEPRELDVSFGPSIFKLSRTPKPLISALFCESELRSINLASSTLGADAIWTGEGGDDLFIAAPTDDGAIDYAMTRGIDSGLFGAINDAARVSRKPYVAILRRLVREALRATPTRSDVVNRGQGLFVTREALPPKLCAYVRHPWIAESSDLPIGKRRHIFALSEVLNRNRLPPDITQTPQIHPLLSQPLLELCLRIPTYMLLKDGRRRGLARTALAHCVPEEILRREDKGAATTFVADAIMRSEAFIQELLLDGILARTKIIDHSSLEPYLAHKRPLRSEHIFPLLSCIAAEIWAHEWECPKEPTPVA